MRQIRACWTEAIGLGDFECMAARYRDVVTIAKATVMAKAAVKTTKAVRGPIIFEALLLRGAPGSHFSDMAPNSSSFVS